MQKPGLYTLEVGLQNLHADDEDGILALCTFGWERAETAVAGKGTCEQATPFHIHDREGGPGQSLYRYLRTTDGLPETIRPIVTPSAASDAVAAARG